ncbi:hypothetical protein AURDEDRAFT_174694 [Auricularia subglabra TFB-10046 SS5]|nr:hypothetical protein AURDEDRAFT_174694 [Auricularia subglabra TFB-10046 SS5]
MARVLRAAALSPSARSANSYTIAVPETALTLEVVLKLALGLSAPLARLGSLFDIDAVIQAAGKYDMPGPGEVLRPLDHRLGAAAASVCRRVMDILPAHAQVLARLVSARQERVKTFFANITAAHDGALFAKEHNGNCRCCGRTLSERGRGAVEAAMKDAQVPRAFATMEATGSAFARENTGVCCRCAREQRDASVWGNAASVRFSDTQAVFAHRAVITFAEQLREKRTCASCGLCPYSWLKIQASSLRDLAMCIDAGSPRPM